MPRSPLPPELDRFLRKPRPAVVGTVTPAGAPVTTPCWYDWDYGRFTISMALDGPRHRNLRAEPRLALTVLGDDWYEHVSLLGRVVELREDPDLADIDALSQRYLGEPYEERSYRGVTAVAEVDRWHVYGNPGGLA
ncbi:MAG TPA: pyridoxamine 5'-phosphate oxidase family protein [Gaiellaceae bacterium]|nr:pyridoxamine 5'-phosphate oxidase family protein [Gaiellaceae bacterium]